MLCVETIGKIRRRGLRDGESISGLARSLQLSRNTVRKYLKDGVEPVYKRKPQAGPQLGPWCGRLDEWLRGDGLLPKARRRTARRLFECLQAEGYAGAYDSVQRHVRQWKIEAGRATSTKAFVPLFFASGDVAQFDWSYEHVVLGGTTTTIKLAHFRLAYSRQMFVVAYPREAQEMVLDAHNRAFAFFGGVPRKVIYDNLKTVVDAVFAGKERQFNRRFLALASHYLFEPVACTPASGWEKGQIENQVGNVREWLFTPTPRFADFAALNAWLATRCRELGARRHPTQDATIAEIFALEQPMLQPVSMPFDAYIEQPLRVSSTCLVSVDRNRYSVPAEWVGKVVSVRISAHGIKVVAGGELVARHERKFGRNQLICEPWHYLSILETKPGALRHGLPFTAWVLPPAVEAVRAHALKQLKGDRAFAELLLVARETGLGALDMACQLAQEQGHLNTSVVLNELRRLTSPPRASLMETPDALVLLLEPVANCARYDELRGVSHV
ncbi:IS21 family transposase [Cypionkella sp. TWP1-2-1b2]|uniref:IS21 family transposase n=1 Tax=Cypionkella sp. TWP1-2-1b2 TaxID=2804675 RepID=UPI003CFAB0DD